MPWVCGKAHKVRCVRTNKVPQWRRSRGNVPAGTSLSGDQENGWPGKLVGNVSLMKVGCAVMHRANGAGAGMAFKVEQVIMWGASGFSSARNT